MKQTVCVPLIINLMGMSHLDAGNIILSDVQDLFPKQGNTCPH